MERSEGVIARAKLEKISGLDGMNTEMLRAMWRGIPGWLMTMFDACLSAGYFPGAWKKARVIVLPKSSEKPRSNPALYRPKCVCTGQDA